MLLQLLRRRDKLSVGITDIAERVDVYTHRIESEVKIEAEEWIDLLNTVPFHSTQWNRIRMRIATAWRDSERGHAGAAVAGLRVAVRDIKCCS